MVSDLSYVPRNTQTGREPEQKGKRRKGKDRPSDLCRKHVCARDSWFGVPREGPGKEEDEGRKGGETTRDIPIAVRDMHVGWEGEERRKRKGSQSKKTKTTRGAQDDLLCKGGVEGSVVSRGAPSRARRHEIYLPPIQAWSFGFPPTSMLSDRA
jgi:hypothetical protein